MTEQRDTARKKRRTARRREGAAMIVVMLVLLSTTALAIFAVHATTSEIQASGHARQGMQAQYLAESGLVAAFAWMDSNGPQVFLEDVRRARAADLDELRLGSANEPELMETKDNNRLHLQDLAALSSGVPPIDADSIGGRRQPYQPLFVVDVNDYYRFTGAIQGNRSDGYGRLQFLHATYTARGRMVLSSDSHSMIGGAAETRGFHEVATDARAHGVSGPF